MIDLTGLDKAEVLAALYNASKPLGMGLLHYEPWDMTVQEAQKLLNDAPSQYKYFDYIKGRVVKVNLTGNTLNPSMYDRDNGEGAAARVISRIATKQAA